MIPRRYRVQAWAMRREGICRYIDDFNRESLYSRGAMYSAYKIEANTFEFWVEETLLIRVFIPNHHSIRLCCFHGT